MPIIDDHGVEASVDDELAGDLGAVGEADAGDEGGVCFLVWRGRWVGGWRRSRRFECVAVSYGSVGGWVGRGGGREGRTFGNGTGHGPVLRVHNNRLGLEAKGRLDGGRSSGIIERNGESP